MAKLSARRDRRVCIVGLGPVGLTLAVAMAEAGFWVRGVDRDERLCALIREGRAPFPEADLDPRVEAQRAAGRLDIGSSWPAKGEAQVFILAVSTPLSPAKTADLSALTAATREVADRLTGGELIVLRSTTPVGASRTVIAPLLDAADAPYHLAFCPERTLQGRALAELRTLPQIVGGRDAAAARRAARLFNRIAPAVVSVPDLETAEMAKLVNNTQRDLMFAFANEVAELCEAAGISAAEVIAAANLGYARGAVPMPGPAGGPCLRKDPYILAEGGFGGVPDGPGRLSLLARRINEDLPAKVVRRLSRLTAGRTVRKILIAGVAFKGWPETADIRGSLAIPLIAMLKAAFPAAALFAHDPAAAAADIAALGVETTGDLDAGFRDADLVVFQTNHLAFQTLDLRALSATMAASAVIYDLWGQFDPRSDELLNGVSYAVWGGARASHRLAANAHSRLAPVAARSRSSPAEPASLQLGSAPNGQTGRSPPPA